MLLSFRQVNFSSCFDLVTTWWRRIVKSSVIIGIMSRLTLSVYTFTEHAWGPACKAWMLCLFLECIPGRFEVVASTLKGWLQACRKFPEIQGSCILNTPSILKYLAFCAEKNLAIGAGSISSKLPKLAKDKFTSLHRSQSQRESQSLNAFQEIPISRISHYNVFALLSLSVSLIDAIYTISLLYQSIQRRRRAHHAHLHRGIELNVWTFELHAVSCGHSKKRELQTMWRPMCDGRLKVNKTCSPTKVQHVTVCQFAHSLESCCARVPGPDTLRHQSTRRKGPQTLVHKDQRKCVKKIYLVPKFVRFLRFHRIAWIPLGL